MDSTHGQTTSVVTYHHRHWIAHTIERHRAWHASIALRQHTQTKDVGRGMTSPHLDSTHGRTTSGVTCHHCLLTAHTVERRWAWHAIITFGQNKWSDSFDHGMPSSPLVSTHGPTTSGVSCHHRLWTAHTIERRRACNAIISFGQHTRSNNVGRIIQS